MSDAVTSTLRCEACGRVLASGNAVCGCAESRAVQALGAAQNLDTQLARREAAARFRCPACTRRFDAAQLKPVAVPSAAPWYRLQISGRACPHCGTALVSRYLPMALQSPSLPLGLILVAMGQKLVLAAFGVDRAYAQAIAIVVIAVALGLLIFGGIAGAWRARRDENAYVRDPRSGSSSPA